VELARRDAAEPSEHASCGALRGEQHAHSAFTSHAGPPVTIASHVSPSCVTNLTLPAALSVGMPV
jgi:hypothetical protein